MARSLRGDRAALLAHLRKEADRLAQPPSPEMALTAADLREVSVAATALRRAAAYSGATAGARPVADVLPPPAGWFPPPT
jgi:hypothetical protein